MTAEREVERWEPSWIPDKADRPIFDGMINLPDGQYVDYADYAALKERAEADARLLRWLEGCSDGEMGDDGDTARSICRHILGMPLDVFDRRAIDATLRSIEGTQEDRQHG
jgi:hypothetical protein